MPYYSYHAIDQLGMEQSGTITADDKGSAIEKLKTMHLYPTKIFQIDRQYVPTAPSTVRTSFFKFFSFGNKTRVTHKDTVSFIRDLAILIEASMPIVKALYILREQAASVGAKTVNTKLQIAVENGQMLSESLRQFPTIFPELYINMVRAGEVGGGEVLSNVLKRLAALCESQERLNSRIRAALTYPVVVLAFALLVVIGLVTFILPKFFVIYDDMNLSLPFITGVLFSITTLLKSYWYIALIAIVALSTVIPILTRNPHVRLWLDTVTLKLPVLGELFLKVSLSRFARTFGTLLNSGVPILQALKIVQDATGNKYISQALEKVNNSIREGESIAAPLSTFTVFPPLVTNMIALGEETGNVSNLLIKVADKYDEEVDTTVMRLTSLLEPMLLLILGVIVGFVIIALFMPLISLMQSLNA